MAEAKRWYVGFKTGAFAGIEVEAETKEEAIDKAEREFYNPRPCHQCSDDFEVGDDWDVDFAETTD